MLHPNGAHEKLRKAAALSAEAARSTAFFDWTI
jgi:hypothetical protein